MCVCVWGGGGVFASRGVDQFMIFAKCVNVW